MSKEIVNAEVHDAENVNMDFMLGLNEIKARANMVTKIKQQIMEKDRHYGVVPGCGEKPTLLKNGAELLCMAFKLASDAKVEIADLGNGHREYTVTTTLTSIVTGTPIATGLGSCSTMESKYRYRGNDLVPTGNPVPQEYWDKRDASLLGGKGFVAKKDDSGKWMIFAKGDKKENPDIADVYNTVLKMASKRSFVDATLKATGGSCEFTQDIEEMDSAGYSKQNSYGNDYGYYGPSEEQAPAQRQSEKTAQKKNAPLSEKKKIDFLNMIADETKRVGKYVVEQLIDKYGGYEKLYANANECTKFYNELKAYNVTDNAGDEDLNF